MKKQNDNSVKDQNATCDNNMLAVRSLENYKSDVKILLEIDTLAWREDAPKVDGNYKGEFLEYDFIISEKEWGLKNLELNAPFRFGLQFRFKVETDLDGNNKRTCGDFESEYSLEILKALNRFGWNNSDLENLELTDEGEIDGESIYYDAFVEMIIDVDYSFYNLA